MCTWQPTWQPTNKQGNSRNQANMVNWICLKLLTVFLTTWFQYFSKWQKLAEISKKCLKLAQNYRNWTKRLKFAKIGKSGQNCQKMAKIGQHSPKWPKLANNWGNCSKRPKLPKNGWDWPNFLKFLFFSARVTDVIGLYVLGLYALETWEGAIAL